MARLDLTDREWSIIGPLLPTVLRGVPRVDDRKVLLGIFWRLKRGAPLVDCRSPLVRTPPAAIAFLDGHGLGIWERILETVSAAYDGDLQMIDSSFKVHHHAVKKAGL